MSSPPLLRTCADAATTQPRHFPFPFQPARVCSHQTCSMHAANAQHHQLRQQPHHKRWHVRTVTQQFIQTSRFLSPSQSRPLTPDVLHTSGTAQHHWLEGLLHHERERERVRCTVSVLRCGSLERCAGAPGQQSPVGHAFFDDDAEAGVMGFQQCFACTQWGG
eukprot:273636-Chlamydomonas_euryale.AAC.1